MLVVMILEIIIPLVNFSYFNRYKKEKKHRNLFNHTLLLTKSGESLQLILLYLNFFLIFS